jgi:hypothetical protein
MPGSPMYRTVGAYRHNKLICKRRKILCSASWRKVGTMFTPAIRAIQSVTDAGYQTGLMQTARGVFEQVRLEKTSLRSSLPNETTMEFDVSCYEYNCSLVKSSGSVRILRTGSGPVISILRHRDCEIVTFGYHRTGHGGDMSVSMLEWTQEF